MGNTFERPKKETPDPDPVLDLSQLLVKEYVDQILASKSTNIAAVPDFAERKAYTIAYTLLFYHLQESLQKTKLVVLGHEITFQVRVLDPTERLTENPETAP
jgi:hypothetical protein